MGSKRATTEGFATLHTFAAGWNAACDDEPLAHGESTDWMAGWREAMGLSASDRETYRFNERSVRPYMAGLHKSGS
jgi:hypothetical protein